MKYHTGVVQADLVGQMIIRLFCDRLNLVWKYQALKVPGTLGAMNCFTKQVTVTNAYLGTALGALLAGRRDAA